MSALQIAMLPELASLLHIFEYGTYASYKFVPQHSVHIIVNHLKLKTTKQPINTSFLDHVHNF